MDAVFADINGIDSVNNRQGEGESKAEAFKVTEIITVPVQAEPVPQDLDEKEKELKIV